MALCRPLLANGFALRTTSARPPLRRFIIADHCSLPRRSIFSLPRIPIFEALHGHDRDSLAVVHSASRESFTYGLLLKDVAAASSRLVGQTDDRKATSLEGQRVAFLIENSYEYVVHLLAILAVNAIALPLAPSFPPDELRYNLNHAQARFLIASSRYEKQARQVLERGLESAPKLVQCAKKGTGHGDGAADEHYPQLTNASTERGGMMLYTSGTTSRPKGVLLPTSVLEAQLQSLCTAWQYSARDRLLHVLPLHHIHGTVNALLAPLYAGSTIEFLYPFNSESVFERFARPFLVGSEEKAEPVTFFTAVPTVYHRLLRTHESLSDQTKAAVKAALKPETLRLNICGSAALPVPTKNAWSALSGGNTLLERYGMTEVGMALSCGLAHHDRVDGSVGWPLPSVQTRLVDLESGTVVPSDSKTQGEIQLKGPTIFTQYWRNPEATASEFTPDGWFKTGDIAYRKGMPSPIGNGDSGSWARGPMYFIQGRQSSDIIKSGGEKVSALEIEREMLSLPDISECAVVGLPSETWGQKIAAVVVLSAEAKSTGRGRKTLSALDLRRALRDRLVAYKIPHELKVVESIPRNAMGKINKKQLVKDVFDGGTKD